MRAFTADIILAVVFFFRNKQNLVCGPVIQCNPSRNQPRNVFKGGVTSALYETWRRLAYRVTDRIYAKQLLQQLEKVGT